MSEQTVTLYGSSDDLVLIEGAFAAEYNVPYNEPEATFHFADGSIVRMAYTDEGVWRAVLLSAACRFTKDPAVGQDSNNYSDRVTLHGNGLLPVRVSLGGAKGGLDV